MGKDSEKNEDMWVRNEYRSHFAEFIAGGRLRLSSYLIIAQRWRAAKGEIGLALKQQYLSVLAKVKY